MKIWECAAALGVPMGSKPETQPSINISRPARSHHGEPNIFEKESGLFHGSSLCNLVAKPAP